MTLKKYREKRNWKKTPEPGPENRSHSSLNFCIQKHAARRLHYDFRLEYKGVLLSWAVPKGPSLNPKDKRLAIKVEDHPIDYQYFEGVIPKGNYGAGTVEIWDHGTYQVAGTHTKKDAEQAIAKGLKEGHFSFIIYGEKLKGEFVLQKLKKDPDDSSWLLFKKEDAFADCHEGISSHENPQKMPTFIIPMLATLVDKPFDDDDWLFEIKWDGYRALAFIDNGKVELKSRSEKSWNDLFPDVVKSLKNIPGQVILDGELVVLDKDGKPDFQLMQNYQKNNRRGVLYYYVFDILYQNGNDLRKLPLIERKEILKKLLLDLSLTQIRFCGHILKNGIRFFNEVVKQKLEGMIAKNLSSAYQSKRSRDWLKVKSSQSQEVVIGGFTMPKGSRKKFGALLIGFYDKKDLIYAGHVGGGFNDQLLTDIYDRLKPLIQKKCPFKQVPKNTKATWVKPKLACEVSFTEWTQDRSMRHPIFKGLRIDKPASQIVKERQKPVVQMTNSQKAISKRSSGLALTNLDKVYWPEEKYTKGDLIHYYESVAKYILPYLKGRPIMLHRYPNGITGNDFYQKNLETHPEWIVTHSVKHDGKEDHYLFIDNLPSLLYAINLGSIDLHPFLAKYNNLENPEFCVIDLDPHDIPFKKTVEAALSIHTLLEKIKVPHYCKTSGGKGLHILIPFKGKYDFTQARQFAELIGYYAHQQLPKTTSLERNPQKRKNKIYIDCLQNRSGQTIVSPYSVRPRPHALVSTPLLWEEVNETLDPSFFNLSTLPARLKKLGGDIWKDIFKKGVRLQDAIKHLKDLPK